MNLVDWWNKHQALAHIMTGLGSSVAVVWASNHDFRAYVENTLHTAPHWIQAVAGLAPFVALIYTNFRKRSTP